MFSTYRGVAGNERNSFVVVGIFACVNRVSLQSYSADPRVFYYVILFNAYCHASLLVLGWPEVCRFSSEPFHGNLTGQHLWHYICWRLLLAVCFIDGSGAFICAGGVLPGIQYAVNHDHCQDRQVVWSRAGRGDPNHTQCIPGHWAIDDAHCIFRGIFPPQEGIRVLQREQV